MQRVLALEDSLPLALSLRFFVSAALFAALAGALLLWHGETALASNWSPAMLAATHLIVLGTLSMAMVGALLQILPVVCGVAIAWPARSAAAIHASLSGGTLWLALALLLQQRSWLAPAASLLLLAVGWLLACCIQSLWQARPAAAGATEKAIRLALPALLITALLGAGMALALAWQRPVPLLALLGMHVRWGLGGWIGILIVGVAFQVIPMFQVTPLYPRRLEQWLPPALLLLVTAASIGEFAPWPGGTAWQMALAAAYAGFGIVTLVLLARRKRPAPDPTTWFWRLSIASLLLGCILLPTTLPCLTPGILFVLGFACSAVMGMLYKIVPFLLWLHWQQLGLPRPVASIRLVIPQAQAFGQCACHAAAVALLAAASLWPAALSRPAALALLLSALYLLLNLVRAVRLRARD